MSKTYFFGPAAIVPDLRESDPQFSCALDSEQTPGSVAVFMVVDGEEFSVFYDGGKTAVFGDRDSAILFVSAYQDAIGRPVLLSENFSA